MYRQANLDKDVEGRLLTWLVGDYSLDPSRGEDDLPDVLASYKDIRESMRQTRNARGFYPKGAALRLDQCRMPARRRLQRERAVLKGPSPVPFDTREKAQNVPPRYQLAAARTQAHHVPEPQRLGAIVIRHLHQVDAEQHVRRVRLYVMRSGILIIPWRLMSMWLAEPLPPSSRSCLAALVRRAFAPLGTLITKECSSLATGHEPCGTLRHASLPGPLALCVVAGFRQDRQLVPVEKQNQLLNIISRQRLQLKTHVQLDMTTGNFLEYDRAMETMSFLEQHAGDMDQAMQTQTLPVVAEFKRLKHTEEETRQRVYCFPTTDTQKDCGRSRGPGD